jgi:hypothetical protein
MADLELLKTLNADLWHTFVRSYAELDVEAYIGLYGPELIRAGGPTGQVHGFAEEAAGAREFFAKVAAQGDKVAIDFRFTERLAAGGLASERGVFQLTMLLAGGEERVLYGRFHTLARRAEDRWHFVADYDSTEGATAEAFNAATAIDDLAAYGE